MFLGHMCFEVTLRSPQNIIRYMFILFNRQSLKAHVSVMLTAARWTVGFFVIILSGSMYFFVFMFE